MAKHLIAFGVLLSAFVPLVSLGQGAGATTTADGLEVTAQKDQSASQQAQDRYECHQWSRGQTGFDPTQPGGGVPAAQAISKRDDYQRAMTACLEARGYAVHVVPAYTPPPYPPAPVYRPAPYYPAPPEDVGGTSLTGRSVTGIVTTGIGFPTGDTSSRLDVGVLLGLGVTWFPVPEGRWGLRLEGNYNWFSGHHDYYYNYAYYNYGQDLYGADLDLELNLTHSSYSRWYLVGGYGGYRVTTYRSPYGVSGCGFYYCGTVYGGPYYSSTSDWRGAWNIGGGWEWAVAPSGAFFIEARYQELIPSANLHFDFIPVTVGFRF